MTEPLRPGHRSRLIVDRRLQFDMVARTVMFVLFVFCLVGALLFSPLARQLTGEPDPQSKAFAEALLFMQDRFWPAAVAALLVGVAGAVFTSHRIAGPFVRMRRAIEEARELRFANELHTRPGDHFKAELSGLNEMIGTLSDQVRRMQQVHASLVAALLDHAQAARTTLTSDAHRSLDRVEECAGRLGALLDAFEPRTGTPEVESTGDTGDQVSDRSTDLTGDPAGDQAGDQAGVPPDERTGDPRQDNRRRSSSRREGSRHSGSGRTGTRRATVRRSGTRNSGTSTT